MLGNSTQFRPFMQFLDKFLVSSFLKFIHNHYLPLLFVHLIESCIHMYPAAESEAKVVYKELLFVHEYLKDYNGLRGEECYGLNFQLFLFYFISSGCLFKNLHQSEVYPKGD